MNVSNGFTERSALIQNSYSPFLEGSPGNRYRSVKGIVGGRLWTGRMAVCPVTPVSDEELSKRIRQVIIGCPFLGEGLCKVRARLRREHGI